MTVQAEQFPIAAIGRVVIVVVVAMMHRELVQVIAREFTRAAATNPRINLEGSLPIAPLALLPTALRLGDYPVQPVVIWFAHLRKPNFAAYEHIVARRPSQFKCNSPG